jgi:hypothetical protein
MGAEENNFVYEKIAAQIEAHEKFAEALTKVLEILSRLQVIIKENHGDQKEQYNYLTNELNEINKDLMVYKELSNKTLLDILESSKTILQKQDKSEGLLYSSISKIDSNNVAINKQETLIEKIDEKLNNILRLSQDTEKMIVERIKMANKPHEELLNKIDDIKQEIIEEVSQLIPLMESVDLINEKLPHFSKMSKNIVVWGAGILFIITVLGTLVQFGVIKFSFFGK